MCCKPDISASVYETNNSLGSPREHCTAGHEPQALSAVGRVEAEEGGALADVLATCEGISASLRDLLGSQAKYALPVSSVVSDSPESASLGGLG